MTVYLKRLFKFTSYILLVIVVVNFCSPTALAQGSAEQVQDFRAVVRVSPKKSILVEETITYDFGGNTRHGIFRDIPYKYKARGGDFSLRISDVSVVTSDTGGIVRSVPYSTSTNRGYMHIKIGDPNSTVTGVHVYKISYKVERAINYFDDYDELYWNVTGNEWKVPILNSSAQVIIESHSDIQPQLACFTGVRGSTASDCSSEFQNREGDLLKYEYKARSFLNAYEGFTIVIGFPKQLVVEPDAKQKALFTLQDNWILGLPVVVLVIMSLLWRRFGKDPDLGVIVPQYEPPHDLSPIDVGTVHDGTIKLGHMPSQLIYLAVLGYLKITKTTTEGVFKDSDDYVLTKASISTPPSPEDGKLLDALFDSVSEVHLAALKKDGTKTLKLLSVLSSYKKRFDARGYYKKGTRGVSGLFVVLGLIMCFASVFVGVVLANLYAGIAVAISGVIIFLFGNKMSVRTAEGMQAYAHVLGFKHYIEVAEKDRIAFHERAEKSPDRFQKLLPFAMVLGLEKAWSKLFEGVKVSPQWYNDSTAHAFSAAAFSNSISNFSSVAASSITTASTGGSGLSGGGSGGGGGGGGGGSW